MDVMEFSSFVRPSSLPTSAHNAYLDCAHTSNLHVEALSVDNLQCAPCFSDDGVEDLDILDAISSEDCAALLPIIRIAFPFLRHMPNSPFSTQHSACTEVGQHVGVLQEEVAPLISPHQAAHHAMALEAASSSGMFNLPVYVEETPHSVLTTLPSVSSIMHSPGVTTGKHQQVPLVMGRGNASRDKYLDTQEGYDSEDLMQITSVGNASKMYISTDAFKRDETTNLQTNASFVHLNALVHRYSSTTCPSASADVLKQSIPHENSTFSLNDTLSLQMGKGGNTGSCTDESTYTAGMGMEMHNPPSPFVPADLSNMKEGPTQENELSQMDHPSNELYKESILKEMPDFMCPVPLISTEGYCSTSEELGAWHPGDLWTRGLGAPAKEYITSLLLKPEPMASLFLDDKILHSIAMDTTSGILYPFLPSLVCVSPDTSTTTSGVAHAPSPLFDGPQFDGWCGDDVNSPTENHGIIDEILRTSSDEDMMTQFKPSETSTFIQIQGHAEPLAGERNALAELHPNGSPSSNDSGIETLKHINDIYESEILKDQACPDSSNASLTEVLFNRRKAVVKALDCVRRQEAKQSEDVTMGSSKECVTRLEAQAQCKDLMAAGYALCLKRSRHAMGGELVDNRQRLMGNDMQRFVKTTSPLSAALSFIVFESGSLGVTAHEALSKLLQQGHANLLNSSQPQAPQVKVALRKCNNVKEVQGGRFIWSSFETDEKHKTEDALNVSHKYSLPKSPCVDGTQETPSTPEPRSLLDAAGSSRDVVHTMNEPRSKGFHTTDQRHSKLSKDTFTGPYHCRGHAWSQSKRGVTEQLPRKLDIEFVKKHQTPEESENDDAKNDGRQIDKHGDKVKFFLRACQHGKASAGGCVNQMTGDVYSSADPVNKHKQLHKAHVNECPCAGDETSLLSGRDASTADSQAVHIPNHMTEIADMGKESQISADSTLKHTLEHAESRQPKCGCCHKNVGTYWRCAKQSMMNSAYCEHHARWCKKKRLKAGGGSRRSAAAANDAQELLVSGLEESSTKTPTSILPGQHAGQKAMAGQHEPVMQSSLVGRKRKGNAQEAYEMDTSVHTGVAGGREKRNICGNENTSSRNILQKSTISNNFTKTRDVKRTKKLSNLQRKVMPFTAKHIQEHSLAAKELERQQRTHGEQCTSQPGSAVAASRQQNFVLQTTPSNRAAATHVLDFPLKGKRSSSRRRSLVPARKQDLRTPHVVPPNLEVEDVKWCKKTDGRQWHCPRHAKPGSNYCEHHISCSNKKKVKK